MSYKQLVNRLKFEQTQINNTSQKYSIKCIQDQYKVKQLTRYLKPSNYISNHISRYLVESFDKVIFSINSLKTKVVVNILRSRKQSSKTIKCWIQHISASLISIHEIFGVKLNCISLLILPTNEEKQFPKHIKSSINAKHVNSGFSYMFTRNSESNCENIDIVIYRTQELSKVIIHELLHVCKVHPFTYDNSIDDNLKHTFNINNGDKLNIFEAYVEFWALWLHTALYSYNTNTTFTDNLKKEKFHSGLKLSYFASKYGIDKDIQVKWRFREIFKESTNAFSYYVIKFAFLQNIPKTLCFIRKQTCKNKYGILVADDVQSYHQFVCKMLNKIDWGNLQKHYGDRDASMSMFNTIETYLKTNL